MTKDEINFWTEYSKMIADKQIKDADSNELAEEVKSLIEKKLSNGKMNIEKQTTETIKNEVNRAVKEVIIQAEKEMNEIADSFIQVNKNLTDQQQNLTKSNRTLGFLLGFIAADSIWILYTLLTKFL